MGKRISTINKREIIGQANDFKQIHEKRVLAGTKLKSEKTFDKQVTVAFINNMAGHI